MSLPNLPTDLQPIHSEHFNQEAFFMDFKYYWGQLKYFYDTITPAQTGEPSTSFYIPKSIPKEHQLAYVNLTRGFPKEVYGGHWCYIVKRFKSKLLVIPTTSVKDELNEADPTYQYDIQVVGFSNGKKTRLQLSDMKTVDIQRVYPAKGYLDVVTDRVEILNIIYDIIEE